MSMSITDQINAIPMEKPEVFVKVLEDHFADEGNPWEVTVRKGNYVKVLESGDAVSNDQDITELQIQYVPVIDFF